MTPLEATELTASLTVRDLERSLAWYRDIVGFEVDRRYEREGALRAVALRAGTVRLLLTQDDGAKGLDRAKGEGFSLQLIVGPIVDELASRIRAHGDALESEPADMPWGPRMFRVRDPDGFMLVFASGR